jgi:two-component system alkaline phosphatase synthesis response regulator PhoP
VDVHVTAIRRKLGELGSCIETVRGVGYRFADPSTAMA